MNKTILLTGATDGIGLEAAKMLVSQGHRVLAHGRNRAKLADVTNVLSDLPGGGSVESFVADLSSIRDVASLADAVAAKHSKLHVLINNAGVFKTPDPITQDGLDVRFVVNALAPYLLTRRLLSLMDASGRVVNLSSAAQAPVDEDALGGQGGRLDDFAAYAQSKLAITMWSRALAHSLGEGAPAIIALNPGSLLGTKMVKEGFGTAGNDIRIGADIICRAAVSDDFNDGNGQYFDNDAGQFAPPHADALDARKCEKIVEAMDAILEDLA